MSILHVEDEEADVLLLKHAFQKAGIEPVLHVAATGREAIGYLAGEGCFADRRQYPLPNLVLLDLKLPEIDGFGVLEWMRRQRHLRTIIVVTLTSSDFEIDIRRAYELGANSYVIKASEQATRVEFVKRLQGWWMDLNQYATAV